MTMTGRSGRDSLSARSTAMPLICGSMTSSSTTSGGADRHSARPSSPFSDARTTYEADSIGASVWWTSSSSSMINTVGLVMEGSALIARAALPERQDDGHESPAPDPGAGDADAAAVLLDGLPAERQAQSRAARFGREQRTEDLAQIGVGDAESRVADLDDRRRHSGSAVRHPLEDPYFDPPAVGHRVHGVLEHVEQHLADQPHIHLASNARCRLAHLDVNASTLSLRVHERQRSTDDVDEVGGLEPRRGASRKSRERPKQLPHLVQLLEADIERLVQCVRPFVEDIADEHEIRAEGGEGIGDLVEDARCELAHRRLLLR